MRSGAPDDRDLGPKAGPDAPGQGSQTRYLDPCVALTPMSTVQALSTGVTTSKELIASPRKCRWDPDLPLPEVHPSRCSAQDHHTRANGSCGPPSRAANSSPQAGSETGQQRHESTFRGQRSTD